MYNKVEGEVGSLVGWFVRSVLGLVWFWRESFKKLSNSNLIIFTQKTTHNSHTTFRRQVHREREQHYLQTPDYGELLLRLSRVYLHIMLSFTTHKILTKCEIHVEC